MKDIEPLLVQSDLTLGNALARLDAGGQGIVLLVDEDGRLIRTVTDGDIRRLLLAGVAMDQPLSVLPELDSRTVPEGLSKEVIFARMKEMDVDHLPVVNAAGCPVALYRRRDLDGPIFLSPPHLGHFEREFVEEALDSNWIAPLGPQVDAFEQELAAHVGISHAAAVSSGTAAIHLALRLLDVERGDAVFCSTFTFVASANPILYQGAEPVFIDSEPSSWNMSPQALEKALADAVKASRLPKAIIVVNLYGQSADMDPILQLSEEYGVPVVEDAAESLGATYRDKASGTLGFLGIYSFNGNKIITTSGGGMLVSKDGELIDRARRLSTQAREPAHHYQHAEVGYNYRLSNVLAGIGRGQLNVLEQRVEARRAVFEGYVSALENRAAIQWMPEASYGRCTRWLTTCVLDPSHTRATPNSIVNELADKRIEVRHLWKPLHRQPLFEGRTYYPHTEEHSVSDDLFDRGLCLPSGSAMTETQQERVVAELKRMAG